MEHGLQTHSLPLDQHKRESVAMRMNFAGADAIAEVEAALATHTGNVRAAFVRIFADSAISEIPTLRPALVDQTPEDAGAKIVARAAQLFGADQNSADDFSAAGLGSMLKRELEVCTNPARATAFLSRIAAAFAKEPKASAINPAQLGPLLQWCGASELFGEMIASRPSLIHVLPVAAS